MSASRSCSLTGRSTNLEPFVSFTIWLHVRPATNASPTNSGERVPSFFDLVLAAVLIVSQHWPPESRGVGPIDLNHAHNPRPASARASPARLHVDRSGARTRLGNTSCMIPTQQ